MTARVPAVLRTFVRRFNAGAFWESHEVLETAWRANGSEFYHGLILYASAFVHVERGNAHGVRAQLRKAVAALGPYAPTYLGIAVGELLALAARHLATLEPTPRDDWRARIMPPTLRVKAAWVRGDEPEAVARGV